MFPANRISTVLNSLCILQCVSVNISMTCGPNSDGTDVLMYVLRTSVVAVEGRMY
jgi:hypothetical protein